mmetsp:Transcript_1576/g.2777  ORF Transcript_1576/g.2777 Transcript_1576/m.2777 type:complete len:91 (+) Transcript_1576:156-428(+)|eukprot:CAMPEP_0168613310 /NCGR_PEP_ID=MMETSP0449_2-20121227/3384_1 /TAXON_ID=1082188 /ORGANISM="Strombidium rassoulzadegani, Strain ras09" /LENGTH=90 /DNA_ID=CAMNT_0008653937 /DNA_START=149 /DNA_END=421 /DNA_ORIENTATION=-
MEMFGVRAANFTHKSFINIILAFMVYNVFLFTSNYNAYWRLRRDPNIPKQWLEESENTKLTEDMRLEEERVTRENRMIGKHGLKDRKYYD